MEAHKIRFTCPVCGMWNSQERLNADHLPFKAAICSSKGLGRGKGFKNTWQKMNLAGAKEFFLRRLANKLRQIADRLDLEALILRSGSTTVAKSATGMTVSQLPLMPGVERYGSTSNNRLSASSNRLLEHYVTS